MIVMLLLAGVASSAGGCAPARPAYNEVRDDAIESLDELAAMVPDPKEVVPGAEQDPYTCDDPVLISRQKGAFYTGHWYVYVSESSDIDAFIASLPTRLSDKWKQQDLGIEVSFANIDLVQEETGVSVAVEEAEIDGRPALDLLAISRCGTLPDAGKR